LLKVVADLTGWSQAFDEHWHRFADTNPAEAISG
jgi:hypothetical protein